MDTVKDAESAREEQLNVWMRQYQGVLLRTCYLYLHDQAAAEDAVQETFIKAYRGMERFRGQCADRTWLTQIAINVCRDTLRGGWFRHVDRKVVPEDLPLGGSQTCPAHNELAIEVMNLPRGLREVIILYYYQGMNMNEIAGALRLSQPAVSSRLKRARSRLRERLTGGSDSDA